MSFRLRGKESSRGLWISGEIGLAAAEKLKDAQRNTSIHFKGLWINTLLIRRGQSCCERPKNKCKPGGQVLSDLIIRLCLDAAAFREQLVRPQRGQCAPAAATLIGAGATTSLRLQSLPAEREKKENSKGQQIIRLLNSFIASLSSRWVYRRCSAHTRRERKRKSFSLQIKSKLIKRPLGCCAFGEMFENPLF